MKTAILITARLKSTKLPKKVIKPIKGRPMICHMIDRLKLAQRPETIIICTSPLKQDDPLADLAELESVECFRGDPDDVLLRLTQAAERWGIDTVVSCTADNPFVDPEYIDYLVDFHHHYNNDFSRCLGLPMGAFAYVISRTAMVRACQIKDTLDTEIWGGYFTQTGLFSWGEMPVSKNVYWPELRLAVDTPEDFSLVQKIFDELYVPDHVFPLRSIVELCRNRPELTTINAEVEQKDARPISIKEEYQEVSAEQFIG
ncbi:hypothetical protein CEE37_07365 [candidate division LCP-89 bacterium B3_LCP]|uniref:3-deoxy-manno-octulosonate cytidylyltransferase n=1 Tax=candidate division LCP-89 bacterium B3_LCP TaxID=2012998 RepID=A0A532V0N0_UNCL8|nr:MAG: hypothetical protein CEE37_07365 [candidate division LCP-89 bacterium B3_LCP]